MTHSLNEIEANNQLYLNYIASAFETAASQIFQPDRCVLISGRNYAASCAKT